MAVDGWQLGLTRDKDIGLSGAFERLCVRVDRNEDSGLLGLRRKNLSFKALRVLHPRTQWLGNTCLLLSFWLVASVHQLGSEHVRLLERVGPIEDLDEVLFANSGMLLKIDVILAILVMWSIFGGWGR